MIRPLSIGTYGIIRDRIRHSLAATPGTEVLRAADIDADASAWGVGYPCVVMIETLCLECVIALAVAVILNMAAAKSSLAYPGTLRPIAQTTDDACGYPRPANPGTSRVFLPLILAPSTETTAVGAAVVNGQNVAEGEFPWQVRWGDNRCGGVLVGPRWILTAAHCVGAGLPSYFVLGDYSMEVIDGPFDHEQRIAATKVITYPSYVNGLAYDIALVQLARPAVINEWVRPIEFSADASEDPPTDTAVIFSGWGGAATDSRCRVTDRPDILQAGAQQIRRYGAPPDVINTLFTTPSPSYAAGGDSGGPVVWYDSGAPRLIGIGIASGCGKITDVQTRVSAYASWIDEQMGQSQAEPADVVGDSAPCVYSQ